MLTEEMTMTYEESVKYLYKISGFATKSSLEDIKYFLERLGNPQKELHMIHVAAVSYTHLDIHTTEAQGWKDEISIDELTQVFFDRCV